jgi:hypothetical protein
LLFCYQHSMFPQNELQISYDHRNIGGGQQLFYFANGG